MRRMPATRQQTKGLPGARKATRRDARESAQEDGEQGVSGQASHRLAIRLRREEGAGDSRDGRLTHRNQELPMTRRDFVPTRQTVIHRV